MLFYCVDNVICCSSAKLHCECTVEMSTLVSCQFSSTKPHYLYTVEEATGGGGYIGVNTCNYEYVDGKVSKWCPLLMK